MFTLAHLSDLHLASQPRLSQLIGKRGLGFINWQRKRKFIHRPEVLDAVTQDLKTQTADHIAVTGDLVNLSLPDEYTRARQWLESLGRPVDVTAIPGNHDVYVRGVEQAPGAFWGDYLRGDDGLQRFPFIRRRGNVALIALSTGLPTAPFLATGCLGTRQLSRFADALDAAVSSPLDRWKSAAPFARRERRRASHSWPRSSPFARLARRTARNENSRGWRAVGFRRCTARRRRWRRL